MFAGSAGLKCDTMAPAAACRGRRQTMDFDFSPAEESFRRELRQMLKNELPDWWIGDYNKEQRAFDVTLRVAGKMAEHGWLTAHWPKEYGGQDAPIWHQVVMREEMARNKEP